MDSDPKPSGSPKPSPSTGTGQAGLSAFWAELKRRKVMRVGITYAIVAWLIIQVASTTFGSFGIPEWAFRFRIPATPANRAIVSEGGLGNEAVAPVGFLNRLNCRSSQESNSFPLSIDIPFL